MVLVQQPFALVPAQQGTPVKNLYYTGNSLGGVKRSSLN